MTREITDLIDRLVRIDSSNPHLAAGGAGEGAVARVIGEWLANAGLDVQMSEPEPGRPNVIGRAVGTGGGRSILLCGHTDTVAGGTTGASVQRLPAGDRIVGPGALDMKAGLAINMLVAAQARRLPLRGDVILAAVIDEEHASAGMRALVGEIRADGAILTEATDLRLGVAHYGSVWLELVLRPATGRGEPPRDRDLAPVLTTLVERLRRYSGWLRRARPHAFLGAACLGAPHVEHGADHISVRLKRYFIPGETAHDAAEELRGALDEIRTQLPAVEITWQLTRPRPAFAVPVSDPIVQTLHRAYRGQRGADAELAGLRAWTDAALLAEAGIPAVIFGPCGSGIHGAAEWVDVSSAALCRDILVSAVRDFCL